MLRLSLCTCEAVSCDLSSNLTYLLTYLPASNVPKAGRMLTNDK